ncbi:MAG: hypothetical protein JWO31_1025, partial [Phycisphaerales bacterium]|nr:hypothetical protein [Phycisphaerales bacterium]
RPYRVDFPAVAAGPVTVEFSSLSTFQRLGIGGRGDESFTLNACEMASPDALTTVELQVSPNSFQVERTTQYDDGQWTVRLSGQRLGRDTSTAQLLVMRSGGGLSRPQTINAEAADLPSLLRENPREANTYLRPLLASLGQEHLFAPDVRVAWQVMAADHWPADPAVAAEVATLLPDLDAPDYHRRDAALARLVAMDRPGAAVLRQLERAGLSAEQDLTIDRALAPFAPLARGEATRLRTDRRFLIDCLCSDDEPTRAAAFRELLQLVGRVDLRYEPAAPTAARLTDVRKLRDELVPGPITRPR